MGVKVSSHEMAKIAANMMSIGRREYDDGVDLIYINRSQLENIWSLCGSVLSQVEKKGDDHKKPSPNELEQ